MTTSDKELNTLEDKINHLNEEILKRTEVKEVTTSSATSDKQPEFEVDEAKVLRGKPIKINDFITISQPSADEIQEFGEKRFLNTFYSLCSISSDMKSVLWDMGLDYSKVSDWDLFLNMCRGFSKEDTQLVFGDIDFSQSQIMVEPNTQEMFLVLGEYDENNNFIPDAHKVISQKDYAVFIGIIREMMGYQVKREFGANKITRMALIDEDRIKRRKAASSKDEWHSTLSSMIISLVNTEEFSYTYEGAWGLTMYQLMKSFVQIQKKKAACSLYQGSMSGFVDTSKIDSKNFQWIYSKE